MRRQFNTTCGVVICTKGSPKQPPVLIQLKSRFLIKPTTKDLHVSIATRLHENVPLSGTVHHLPGPNICALTQNTLKITVGTMAFRYFHGVCVVFVCNVCVRCVGVCSAWVWCVLVCCWLCVCVCCCVWLCGCGWGPPGSVLTLPFSSLLHHLPGTNMCVAHALKITVCAYI